MERHSIDAYRETLTEVVFIAFDKQQSSFFYDSTPEQCTNYIWDNVAPTAVIIWINFYKLGEYQPVRGFKKKLTDNELARKYKNL